MSLKLLFRVTTHVFEFDHTALRSCVFKQAMPSALIEVPSRKSIESQD